MSLDLDELKTLHDKAYNAGQTTRESASNDMVFYWITQWDEGLLEDVDLLYRGQFDVLRKAGRQILSQLKANPVQVDFDPIDDEREDGAELLDGLYRADDRKNYSIEAYDMASQDSVVCGVGAWELYTDYQTRRGGDNEQVIKRRYIPEACNTVFWDPNAKALDKTDATYCSVLTAYSEDGYKALVEELTGTEPDVTPESFKAPEHSYTFPWISGDSKKIYVTNFYQTELIKQTVLTMQDPFGDTIEVKESALADVMDEMIDSGYIITAEKEVKLWQVTKYIASGADILSTEVISGEYIPVISVYGERAIIEGEEHYEGIVRLAKDPQRLRNFQMSYLADIVSRSPRSKPIFTPEQIQGFEDMYDVSGAENNYPYLLQNTVTADGQQLPIGPVAQMPDVPIPVALTESITLSREAVADVADPGLPQDIADPDLSGKAVIALQNRIDNQSYVYLHNLKHAKRRDGEVYASIAAEIYDAPRKVTVAAPDGTTKKVEVMQTVIDRETGRPQVINDLTNSEFEVFADVGPQYASQREATIEQLTSMAEAVAQSDPQLHRALILKIATQTDGVEMDDIKEYASKQLLIGGFRDPEDEKEEAILAESQQNQQPDAMTIAAMAEDKKAQAALMREQNNAQKIASGIEIDQGKLQVDAFRAETDREAVMVDAQEAGANIRLKESQIRSAKVTDITKLRETRGREIDRFRASAR